MYPRKLVCTCQRAEDSSSAFFDRESGKDPTSPDTREIRVPGMRWVVHGDGEVGVGFGFG